MRYGRELVLERCDAGGSCAPVTLDLAAERQTQGTVKPLQCSARFHLAVDVPAGVDPNAYEAAILETDAATGIVSLHTNGEPWQNSDAWVATVKQAFAPTTGRLLVDKRRGDGGGGAALATWGAYLRRDTGYGPFNVPRIDYAAIDGPPTFLPNVFSSCNGRSTVGDCAFGQFEAYAAAPGALPSKVAWLDVRDGSASDISSYFAKGAPGVRIFAPNRTMGLFGGLNTMGAFLEGWSGGSVQIFDTREGSTNAELLAGAWHSGEGVTPDEVIVQKQSDLVLGKDTMLERARAWLTEP
jgi:hypothetical protein